MYVVMERIDGTPLSKRPPREVRRSVAAAVAEGLAAIHELGIVHRDLKPSNVILDREGVPHITDFGLAAPTSAEALIETASMASTPEAVPITQGSFVIGTPFYMAPELTRGGLPSAAADVYALGLVLFELFVGTRPFEAPPVYSPKELQPREVDALTAAAGADVAALIARCVSLVPEQRPTVSEIASGLA